MKTLEAISASVIKDMYDEGNIDILKKSPDIPVLSSHRGTMSGGQGEVRRAGRGLCVPEGGWPRNRAGVGMSF